MFDMESLSAATTTSGAAAAGSAESSFSTLLKCDHGHPHTVVDSHALWADSHRTADVGKHKNSGCVRWSFSWGRPAAATRAFEAAAVPALPPEGGRNFTRKRI